MIDGAIRAKKKERKILEKYPLEDEDAQNFDLPGHLLFLRLAVAVDGHFALAQQHSAAAARRRRPPETSSLGRHSAFLILFRRLFNLK